jgi:hypothetical protein
VWVARVEGQGQGTPLIAVGTKVILLAVVGMEKTLLVL